MGLSRWQELGRALQQQVEQRDALTASIAAGVKPHTLHWAARGTARRGYISQPAMAEQRAAGLVQALSSEAYQVEQQLLQYIGFQGLRELEAVDGEIQDIVDALLMRADELPADELRQLVFVSRLSQKRLVDLAARQRPALADALVEVWVSWKAMPPETMSEPAMRAAYLAFSVRCGELLQRDPQGFVEGLGVLAGGAAVLACTCECWPASAAIPEPLKRFLEDQPSLYGEAYALYKEFSPRLASGDDAGGMNPLLQSLALAGKQGPVSTGITAS
jgi:hypothetical protein